MVWLAENGGVQNSFVRYREQGQGQKRNALKDLFLLLVMYLETQEKSVKHNGCDSLKMSGVRNGFIGYQGQKQRQGQISLSEENPPHT